MKITLRGLKPALLALAIVVLFSPVVLAEGPGEPCDSLEGSVPAVLDPPVVDVTPGCKAITLTWTNPDGANSFVIRRDGVEIDETEDPFYWNDGLDSLTTYSYEVKAKGAGLSDSPWSAPVCGIPHCIEMKASNEDCDSLVISWTDLAAVDRYVIMVTTADTTVLDPEVSIDTVFTNRWVNVNAGDTASTYILVAIDSCGNKATQSLAEVAVWPGGVETVWADEHCDAIDLYWDHVDRAAWFNVYRMEGGSETLIGTAYETHASDSLLDPDTKYCYKVKPGNDCGESQTSEEEYCFRTDCDPEVEIYHSIGCDSIIVWWEYPSETEYINLYVDDVLKSDLTGDTLFYTPAGSEEHCFEIKAYDADSNLIGFDTVCATAEQQPDPVTGFTCTPLCDTVMLSWDKIEGIEWYYIYRDSAILDSTDALQFWDTAPGEERRCYNVAAVSEICGEGNWSETCCTTADGLPDPPVITVCSEYCGDVEICWDPVADATGYSIILDTETVGSTGDNCWNTDTLPAGSYEFVVVAFNDCGYSEPSAPSCLVSVGEVDTVAVMPLSDCSEIALSWVSPDSAVRYTITRNDSPIHESPVVSGDNWVDDDPEAGDNCYSFEFFDRNDCLVGVADTCAMAMGPPDPVSGLDCSSDCNHHTVSWDPSPGALYYVVYFGDSPVDTTAESEWTSEIADLSNYWVHITAVNHCDASGYTDSCELESGGSVVPENFACSSGCMEVILTWDEVAGADGYNVYRDGDFIGFSDSAGWVDNPGDTLVHEYWVTSISEDCPESDYSDHCFASADEDGDLSPPDSLVCTPLCEAILIEWPHVAGAEGYVVKGDCGAAGLEYTTDTFFVADELPEGQDCYTFAVAAHNACDFSDFSDFCCTVPHRSVPQPPGFVILSHDTIAQGDTIRLWWDEVPEADSYYIYRNEQIIDSVSPSNINWLDIVISDSGLFAFYVQSCNDCGCGPFSDSAVNGPVSDVHERNAG